MPLSLPLYGSARRVKDEVKVMLINPPQSYPQALKEEYQSYFPAGIACLGSAVEELGALVELVDCLAVDSARNEGDLIWFGMPFERLRRRIEAFDPDIVGLTNPFSMFLSDAIRTAELVRSAAPKALVVLGGIEASVAPNNRRLLENCRALDVLVKGEGELTLRELVLNFSRERRAFADLASTPGVLFRDESGDVVETGKRPWIADLDGLPLPAYHLLDMDEMFANPSYAKQRSRSRTSRCLPVHTSRGCPYSCNFCSVHSQVGKANRRHTAGAVAEHIAFLKRTYGVNHVHFEDDNLTVNPKHTAALMEALSPLKITFDTPNGIRADTITPEVARSFREAGANSITIAVESGVQWVLDDVVRKALDLSDVIRAAESLDAVGVPCACFFIIGFPGESEREIRETLRFAKRLATEHHTINMLFVATPLPGTPLFKQCEQERYLVDALDKNTLLRGIRLNQAPLIETPAFSKRDLFLWAREELDVPEIVSKGTTIPISVANTALGRARLSRFAQYPAYRMRGYPWRRGYADDATTRQRFLDRFRSRSYAFRRAWTT